MSNTVSLRAQMEHAALQSGIDRTLLRDGAAKIAELEAEIPAQQQITINALARIAELEAEVARLVETNGYVNDANARLTGRGSR